MSYAFIAPLILGFSTVGLCFVYLVYKYNFLYIYDSEIDTKGLTYPYALSHLLVGMYFAEICLIGLFALQYAVVPTALVIALLIFTILVHLSLLDAIGPLLVNLPVTLANVPEDEIIDNNMTTTEDPIFDEDEQWAPFEEESGITHEPGETRDIEGLPAGLKALKSGLQTLLTTKVRSEASEAGITLSKTTSILKPWTSWFSPDPDKKPNFIIKWLHPEIFSDYTILRQSVPPASALPDPLYPPEIYRYIYCPPAMYSQAPHLWVPRDQAGVSAQEVAHSSKVVQISDEDGTLDEDGAMSMDFSTTRYLRQSDRLRY